MHTYTCREARTELTSTSIICMHGPYTAVSNQELVFRGSVLLLGRVLFRLLLFLRLLSKVVIPRAFDSTISTPEYPQQVDGVYCNDGALWSR